MSDLITLNDLVKCEFRVGTVLTAEALPKSRLLKLSVDFGEEIPKQILAGIGNVMKPEDIAGKQYVFVTNLAPVEMKGLVSEGMIFAAKDETGLALVSPTQSVKNGTRLS